MKVKMIYSYWVYIFHNIIRCSAYLPKANCSCSLLPGAARKTRICVYTWKAWRRGIIPFASAEVQSSSLASISRQTFGRFPGASYTGAEFHDIFRLKPIFLNVTDILNIHRPILAHKGNKMRFLTFMLIEWAEIRVPCFPRICDRLFGWRCRIGCGKGLELLLYCSFLCLQDLSFQICYLVLQLTIWGHFDWRVVERLVGGSFIRGWGFLLLPGELYVARLSLPFPVEVEWESYPWNPAHRLLP